MKTIIVIEFDGEGKADELLAVGLNDFCEHFLASFNPDRAKMISISDADRSLRNQLKAHEYFKEEWKSASGGEG